MGGGFDLWRFLSMGMWQIPTILLCIVGIIFALGRKDTMPKAATILMVSLGAMLLLCIARPIGNEVIWGFLRSEDMRSTATLSSVWSIFCMLIDVAATAGVIFAVFCDREAYVKGNTNPFAGDYIDPKNPYAVPTATPVGPWPPTQ